METSSKKESENFLEQKSVQVKKSSVKKVEPEPKLLKYSKLDPEWHLQKLLDQWEWIPVQMLESSDKCAEQFEPKEKC